MRIDVNHSKAFVYEDKDNRLGRRRCDESVFIELVSLIK